MVHREDVTQLRIRIPMPVEEEENDFWLGEGWNPYDDWQAYYDYQDYLAELREAQHQLMSDVWDW